MLVESFLRRPCGFTPEVVGRRLWRKLLRQIPVSALLGACQGRFGFDDIALFGVLPDFALELFLYLAVSLVLAGAAAASRAGYPWPPIAFGALALWAAFATYGYWQVSASVSSATHISGSNLRVIIWCHRALTGLAALSLGLVLGALGLRVRSKWMALVVYALGVVSSACLGLHAGGRIVSLAGEALCELPSLCGLVLFLGHVIAVQPDAFRGELVGFLSRLSMGVMALHAVMLDSLKDSWDMDASLTFRCLLAPGFLVAFHVLAAAVDVGFCVPMAALLDSRWGPRAMGAHAVEILMAVYALAIILRAAALYAP